MNANAKLWVETLRSGRFQQARGAMCRGPARCCLAVACELYIEARLPLERHSNSDGYAWFDGNETSLPNAVCDWLGLNSVVGSTTHGPTLMGLNDSSKWSFAKIADFIESEPKGLFVTEGAACPSQP